jgi:signal transduction histidine kinase
MPLSAVTSTSSALEPICTILAMIDTGIGIAPQDLRRIFDRFYRADPSRNQVEGSGLGLSIARRIAEMHYAELTVASAESMGTAFQIAFPLRKSRFTDESYRGSVRGV